jgi:hypothetical protein
VPDGDRVDSYAALIGDVVSSRRHPHRRALAARIDEALEAANGRIPALQPLVPTVGDEFQGLYGEVRSAIDASLVARLALLGEVDVRFGIGWGELTAYDPARVPLGQDGPAWWSARAAVESVKRVMREREVPRGLRTWFVHRSRLEGAVPSAPSVGGPAPDPHRPAPPPMDVVNAYLLCRDELVSRMDGRDARILLAILEGATQSEVAAREGISQSAVSQRLVRSGAYALRAAMRTLEDLPA